MILKNSINKDTLRIALDLDDTIFDWMGTFKLRFPNANWKDDFKITKLVRGLKYDKQFWENLPLLEAPDFIPEIYSTKRVNSKVYTRNNLKKYGLPIRPIYQTTCQYGNKAGIIRGKCDVLVDDSIRNVIQCIEVGLPAILISRPHNEHADLPRIHRLCREEIWEVYSSVYL